MASSGCLTLYSMYKDAHYILLVYDITKYSTFKSITTKWYNEAISHSPNSVVLVLGTKVDLSTVNREVSIQEVEHFAAEHELFFMEVSAVDTTNIELTLKVSLTGYATILTHSRSYAYVQELCCLIWLHPIMRKSQKKRMVGEK